jgi:hypothetical protein
MLVGGLDRETEWKLKRAIQQKEQDQGRKRDKQRRDPVKHREYMRQYMRDNPEAREQARLRSARRYAENPELQRQKARERREQLSKDPKWVEHHRQVNRKSQLKRYGLTAEQHDAMLKKQHGLCAICLKPPSSTKKRTNILHVDHCHVTGKVRGLLCARCNVMLAHLENPAWTPKAQAYLSEAAKSRA